MDTTHEKRPPFRVTISGQRYRVYDATEPEGQLFAANAPAEWGTMRIFVDEIGRQQRYTFRAEDVRALDSATLARQLANAEPHTFRTAHKATGK